MYGEEKVTRSLQGHGTVNGSCHNFFLSNTLCKKWIENGKIIHFFLFLFNNHEVSDLMIIVY